MIKSKLIKKYSKSKNKFKFKYNYKFKHLFLTLLIFILIFFFLISLKTPSNDRNWSPDQKVLSFANIDNNLIHIKNIRNFTYRNETDYDIFYYNKTFDIDKIKKVYYIVEPFSSFEGLAHTFLSFEFEDNNFVSISVEIRKEVGESFSPYKGILNKYELMYVIGDENDLIKLRTNYRNDSVYLYPINTTKDKIKKMFISMINRTNDLHENPEFYNTIFSTCTTNILDHVNLIRDEKISYSKKIFFPGYSDKILFETKLIDSNLSFKEGKQYYLINDLALKYANDTNFSMKIRK